MNEKSKLFEQLPKGSISDIIIKRITDALLSGELKPGDKIPTESEFSQKLGVGRNAVREATKVLISFGVLEVRRSEGTFIVDQFNQKLLDPIVYGLIMANKSMNDLVEFKITFLNSVLYLAIQKASKEDVNQLRECYNKFHDSMHEEPKDFNKMYAYSLEFYETLGEMSANPLIIQLNKIVLNISRYSRLLAIEKVNQNGSQDYLLSTYEKLINLLEERDMRGIPAVIEYILFVWKHVLNVC